MEKITRSKKEKEALKHMIDADVNQKMIAKHLDITPQAVNNRLKRGSTEVLHEAIEDIKRARGN